MRFRGAIIGAHYYLQLRKLLQEKSDDEITRQDYIDLVKVVADDFLAGVQTNIRMRVAASWWTNVKMIFRENYSRTMRVGELYEKHIYSRIDDRREKDKDKPRWLNELIVQPKNEAAGFTPKDDNWRRAAKCRSWCSTVLHSIPDIIGSSPPPGWASSFRDRLRRRRQLSPAPHVLLRRTGALPAVSARLRRRGLFVRAGTFRASTVSPSLRACVRLSEDYRAVGGWERAIIGHFNSARTGLFNSPGKRRQRTGEFNRRSTVVHSECCCTPPPFAGASARLVFANCSQRRASLYRD